MKKECKKCGKKTKYMFSMNEGIYCDKCKEYGVAVQRFNMETEMFKDRMKMYREKFERHIVYPFTSNP